MTPRIKVLYITYLGLLESIPKSQVLPYLGGLSQNFDIFLLSFEKKNLLKQESKELKRISDILSKKGIAWYRLSYHKYPRILSSLYDIFIGTFWSLMLIYRHKISIIHARSNIPVAIGFILKAVTRIKLIYDRRGIMGEEHIENSGWKHNGWLYRMAVGFEKKVLKKSDATIVLTERMNKALKKNSFLKKKGLIYTIPCCADLQKFRRTPPQHLVSNDRLTLKEKFVFVYSGSLGTYNLLKEMLDFFNVATQFIHNAHFLILTPHEHIVSATLPTYKNLNPQHITIINASHDEMPSYLSLADVGLIFRQDSPTAIAASPTKMGEYLACGLPIVSLSKIGDTKDLLESHKIGAIIKSYETKEYTEAIHRIRHLFKEEKELRERCRYAAELHFDLDCGVKSYSEIYRSLTLSI